MRFLIRGADSRIWADECHEKPGALLPPNYVYRAVDQGKRGIGSGIVGEADIGADYLKSMFFRPGSWAKRGASWDLHRQVLRAFVFPSSSGVTLGTLSAYSATGTRTYTPATEGLLLSKAGILTQSTDENQNVAGMLLGDYFLIETDNVKQDERDRVVALDDGDLVHLVFNGDVELYSDATVVMGDKLMLASNGQVTPAPALDVTTTTTLATTSVQRSTDYDGKTVAIALAARTGAGLVRAMMCLPRTWSDINFSI